jgi:hypothetical protein
VLTLDRRTGVVFDRMRMAWAGVYAGVRVK